MFEGSFEVGDLVYWSIEPLAFYMKPDDSMELWKIGMFVEHKNDNQGIIMFEGELYKCSLGLVKPFLCRRT
jgi:hypothetical protein